MSPWQLPGEPNRASAVWLAAGDQTSLGGVSQLFSHSQPITIHIYNIGQEEKQGGNRCFAVQMRNSDLLNQIHEGMDSLVTLRPLFDMEMGLKSTFR